MPADRVTRAMAVAALVVVAGLLCYRVLRLPAGSGFGAGELALIAALVVLALAEVFDRFDLAGLGTLERDVERARDEAARERTRADALVEQVLRVSLRSEQHQRVTVALGGRASAAELVESDGADRGPDFVALREAAVAEWSAREGIADDGEWFTPARLVLEGPPPDDLSNWNPTFHGYHHPTRRFVLVRRTATDPSAYRDRLHALLAKLAAADAQLVLLLAGDEEAGAARRRELAEAFAPALAGGRLAIAVVAVG